MGFKPGEGGRPKGAINRRTQEARDIAAEVGYCPLKALMNIHQIAMDNFREQKEKIQALAADASERPADLKDLLASLVAGEGEAVKYLKIAADTAADTAGYIYPKLKSIEQKNADPTAHLTPEERLVLMEQAVTVQRALVQKAKDGGSSAA